MRALRPLAEALFAIGLGVGVILLAHRVLAQEHDDTVPHWYESDCCSGEDCRKLAPGEYKMVDGVWYLRNVARGRDCGWQTFSKPRMSNGASRVRPSRDFAMHGCFQMSGTGCTPLCAYVGGGV